MPIKFKAPAYLRLWIIPRPGIFCFLINAPSWRYIFPERVYRGNSYYHLMVFAEKQVNRDRKYSCYILSVQPFPFSTVLTSGYTTYEPPSVASG